MENVVYFFIDAPWWLLALVLVFGVALAVALARPVRIPMVVAGGLVGLAGSIGLLAGAVIDDRMGFDAEDMSLTSLTVGPMFGYLAGLAALVRSQWRTVTIKAVVPPAAGPSPADSISDVAHGAPSRSPATARYSISECLTTVGLTWWTAGSILIWVCGSTMGALSGFLRLTVLNIVLHDLTTNLTPGLFHTPSYELALRTPSAIVGGEVACAVALLTLCSWGPWRDGFLDATLRLRTRLGWVRRHRAAARFNLVPLAAFPIGLVCLFVGVSMGVNFVSGSRLTPGEQLHKSILLCSGLGFLVVSCLATNLALLRNERWPGLTALGLCLNAFPILHLVAGLPFEGSAVVVGCLSGSLFIWLVVRWINRRANGSRAF